MAHELFISYSSKNAEAAFAIVDLFESAGLPCWIAPRDPVPGLPYAQQIVNAIDRARAVVLLLSDDANRSPAVLGEIEIAANRKRTIVPVRIEDVQPNEALEYYVRAAHWFDAYHAPFEDLLRPLISSMPAILTGLDAPGARAPLRVAAWRGGGRGPFAFLFTDIEGSTKLWERDAAAMSRALERHDAILREAIEARNGYVFKTVGDAFCAAFPTAGDAVAAAVRAQQALAAEAWDDATGRINVRMAVHAGEAEQRNDDFFGPTLNRVARLQAVAHPGQILASAAVAAVLGLPDVELIDLGDHRLKDLAEPLRVYQVAAAGLPREFPPLASLDLRRTNLPAPPNELIGRERELTRAAAILRDSPLLSIVATGGMGKTRFALQLAANAAADFPDGVWFVDLAAIERGELVAASIARVLAVPERPGVDLLDAIAEALAKQRTLLVLDNCEHVIDAAARAIAAIGARANDVRIVATSREPLAIAAERQLRLGPLPLPDARANAAELLAAPSVRLFIERVRAQNASFDPDDATLSVVAEICIRLDGIPLAMELAAARTGLFDVRALAGKMDDLLRLLAQKRRDVSPRQQTLEALVDWSYKLLADGEREAFERLGAFAGAFSIEAAFAVAGFGEIDEFDLETHLESLIEKSFVVVEGEGETRRFRLYETLRQFAERRLRARPEAHAEAVSRHVAYYARLATLATRAGAEDLGAIDAALANVRAAFRAALAASTSPADAGALALGLARYSLQVGAIGEGSHALERGRAIAGLDGDARRWIEYVGGEFAMHVGRFDEARRAYAAAAEAGAADLAARARVGLARIELAQGDAEAARRLIGEALSASGGDTYAEFVARTQLVNIELAAGRRAQARAEAELAFACAERLGERALSFGAGNLGTLAFLDGDLETAARLIDRAIAASERSQSRLSLAYYRCIRSEIALFGGEGDAIGDARKALDFAFEAEAADLAQRCVETLAAAAGRRGEGEAARRLLAWVDAERARRGAAAEGDDDDRALSARKRELAGASSGDGEAIVLQARKDDADLLSFVKEFAR